MSPAHRRHGIGRGLVEAAVELARRWGSTEVHGWITHHRAAAGDPGISATPLGLEVAIDSTVEFARGLGFALAQAEQASVWDLDATPPAEPTVHPDYRLVHWAGMCPDQWLADMAGLHTALHRDIPKGELMLNHDEWTPERVIAHDRDAMATQQLLVTAALHQPSGHLVGYTQLSRNEQVPGAAWQDTTVVEPAHRGHGLGRAIKLANARAVLDQWPATRRVRTWNAAENAPMLNINTELGFVPTWITAAWTLTV